MIASFLTMTSADSEADALVLAVKHHVEALHDDGTHDSSCARLGHGKLVAVLLGRGHVLYRTQVLLQGGWRRGEERDASEVTESHSVSPSVTGLLSDE